MENRAVVIEGYLVKSPPEEKIKKNYRWCKRYFRLWSDETLEYFKKADCATTLKEPLNLKLCLGILETDKKYEKHFHKAYKYPFCLNMKNRQYHLVAESEMQRNQWKLAITDVCGFGPNMTRSKEETVQIMTHEAEALSRRASAASNVTESGSSGKGSPRPFREISETKGEPSPLLATGMEEKRFGSISSGASSTGVLRNSSTSLQEEENDLVENGNIFAPYNLLPPPVPANNMDWPYENDADYPRGNKPFDSLLDASNEEHVNYSTPKSLQKQISFGDDDLIDTSTIRSPIIKQASTKSKNDVNNGSYMQMIEDNSYIQVEATPAKTKEQYNKKFRPVRTMTSLPQQKKTPQIAPKSQTLNIKYKSYNDGVIMDVIPKMPNKVVSEIRTQQFNAEDPPEVDRQRKPVMTPKIDRSTKPRFAFLPENQFDEESQLVFSKSLTSENLSQGNSSHNYANVFEHHNTHESPFSTHFKAHTDTEHTSDTYVNDVINFDALESEETYFNHKITNRPSVKMRVNYPEDGYDNLKLRDNSISPRPNFVNNLSNFHDNNDSYTVLRPDYAHTALPKIPYNNTVLSSSPMFSAKKYSSVDSSTGHYNQLQDSYAHAELPELPSGPQNIQNHSSYNSSDYTNGNEAIRNPIRPDLQYSATSTSFDFQSSYSNA